MKQQFNSNRNILTVSTVLAILATINLANAQSKTITFETGTWEEIKAKSLKENKLIFLDAYATWCGICKKMDKNVFTNDTVANYFNANFINAKIDMEAGEGISLARRYNINVYPNLLFIDGQGNIVNRAEGGLKPQQFIELAIEAQNPNKQNKGAIKTHKEVDSDVIQTNTNKIQIGFHISQYQKDFGVGVQIVSPYFFRKMVAIKAGTNIQWLEYFNGAETVWTNYQNFQLGMRGRSFTVGSNMFVYGEGGAFFIIPNSDFSSENLVGGGYGLLGFEFKPFQKLGYFIEFGGVGSGATADKIVGKPIYSTGFLTNVGIRIGF